MAKRDRSKPIHEQSVLSQEEALALMREAGDGELTVSLSQVVPIGEFGNVRLGIEVSGLKTGEHFEADLLRAVTAAGEALKVLDTELDNRLSEMTSTELLQGRALLTERVRRIESWQAVVRSNLQDIVSKVKELREGRVGEGEPTDPAS